MLGHTQPTGQGARAAGYRLLATEDLADRVVDRKGGTGPVESMAIRVKICGITCAEDAAAAVAAGADALGFIFYPPSPRAVTPEAAQRIIAALPPFVSAVGVFVDEPVEQVRRLCAEVGLHYAQLHGAESVDACRALGGRAIKALRVASPPGNGPRHPEGSRPPILGGRGGRLRSTVPDDPAPAVPAGGTGAPGHAVKDRRPDSLSPSMGGEGRGEGATGRGVGATHWGIAAEAARYRDAVAAILLDTYHPTLRGGTGARFDWSIARQVAAGGTVILSGGLTPENVAEAVRVARPYAVDVSSGVERAPGRKDHDRVRAFIVAARRAALGPSPLGGSPLGLSPE